MRRRPRKGAVMQESRKILSRKASNVELRVIPGHFVTQNSHINYFVDMTTMKTRLSEAKATAEALSLDIMTSTVVDSIVCMDGTEVIGAFLADELTKAGVLSMNQHKTIYVVTPEYDMTGQMIFRENLQIMVRGKHVLILLASATTGRTILRAIDCIHYYGGEVSGISAIFSAANRIGGMDIHALFTPAELPDYRTYTADKCEMCRRGEAVDAMANGFGYSRL